MYYVCILLAIHPTEDLLATGHICKPLVMFTQQLARGNCTCLSHLDTYHLDVKLSISASSTATWPVSIVVCYMYIININQCLKFEKYIITQLVHVQLATDLYIAKCVYLIITLYIMSDISYVHSESVLLFCVRTLHSKYKQIEYLNQGAKSENSSRNLQEMCGIKLTLLHHIQ